MRVRFLKRLTTIVGTAVILLSFALPVAAQPAPPTPSQEQIQSFTSRITVNDDGTIGVDENIGYYFPAPRHGIYRDLPLRYDIDGKTVEMPITDIGVQEGTGSTPVPFTTETNKDSVRIKIGDPNATVEGLQTYDITYAVSGALRYFSDHDELYWNATGNTWTVPISDVSVSVVPPTTAPRNKITTKCYTGPTGSLASDCVSPPSVGQSADFAASSGPLTVVVGWPPGLVVKLLPRQVSPWENALPLLPFALPIIVIVLLYLRWNAKGRGPKGSPTLVVQYDPPAGLTPAETGAVFTESETAKDLSSTIVDLAVRGYLVIREVDKQGLITKSKDYEFDLRKDFANDAALKPFEKQVLTTLFAGAKTASVSAITAGHTFYQDVPKIQAAVFAQLVGDGYFPSDPMKIKAAYAGPGILVIFVAFAFFPGAQALFSGSVGGNVGLAIVISAVAVIIGGQFMAPRTLKGVEARDHAKGFLEYLKTAEKYRMQWQEKENIFEKYLPYAMAFGVVDKWSNAFASMNLPPPQWYQGAAINAGVFNAVAFSGAMNGMSTAMSSAMQSRPQSSSGGSGFSGGFSGGGGGGGGGGSW